MLKEAIINRSSAVPNDANFGNNIYKLALFDFYIPVKIFDSCIAYEVYTSWFKYDRDKL